MAKAKKAPLKKTKATTSPKTRPAATRRGLQGKIDETDRKLTKLLQERARLVVEASKQGIELNAVTATGGVDDEIINQVAKSSRGPLAERTVCAILRELHSGCRELVRHLRIACLGPQYSYTHLAAIRRFGQAVEFVPVGTIAAVFEEVNGGHSDYGVVPVENSTDGRIADTLDMFTRLPVRICGQVEMEIHHTLLGKGARDDVREVYSKPQALSQCRNWLAKHLPSARTIEVTSTTMAAKLAAEKPDAAAIASVEAGVHYGLNALAERIEDNPDNMTRFVVIGNESAPRSGNDRTALLFQVEHRPGTLADAMNIFKRSRVNLTWIESFPIPGSDRAYLFFVEMEGHETDIRLKRAVAALEKKALRLEILGSFPVVAADGEK